MSEYCSNRFAWWFIAASMLVAMLLPADQGALAQEKQVVIITLGDSITRGVRAGVKPEETFAALLQQQLRQKGVPAKVINAGIGGERTDQALQRLEKAVLALKPQVVTIMYGTNDSYVDQGQKEPRLSAEQYGKNLRELVHRLRTAGIKPILMTPPCWGARAAPNGAGENPNSRLEKYVQMCRKVAADTSTPLVDHFQHWSRQRAAGADIGQWTTDQCHPNPQGHREIAKLLLPELVDRPDRPAPPPAVRPPQVRHAVERGLAFLEQDAARWRKERKCATCHHGTMTLWAFAEAKSQSYPIAAETLTQTAKWTKERLERIDQPRDPRPGWKMVNTPAIYLALLAQFVPGQEVVSAAELKQITGHLLRHQENDGSWAWSSAPAKNRPPPYFESDEVATLLAYLALGPQVPADPRAQSPVRDSRSKAAAWLKKTAPSDSTQAAALRLLVKVRSGVSGPDLQVEIEQLLRRQQKDGGWGQLRDRPSDAYATGQVLYVLSRAGLKSDRAEVARGRAFLLASQKADGSWPMTPRAHPGATPSTNPVPIIHFGSAWATLGLMRSAPP
jgi:acyl-CoA thioesterase-1